MIHCQVSARSRSHVTTPAKVTPPRPRGGAQDPVMGTCSRSQASNSSFTATKPVMYRITARSARTRALAHVICGRSAQIAPATNLKIKGVAGAIWTTLPR